MHIAQFNNTNIYFHSLALQKNKNNVFKSDANQSKLDALKERLVPKLNELGVYSVKIEKLFDNKIDKNIYYIKMDGYDKQDNWANTMINSTYKIADLIKNDAPFETIIHDCEKSVYKSYVNIRNRNGSFGKRRRETSGYFIICSSGRGSEYLNKYADAINSSTETKNKTLISNPGDKFASANLAVCRLQKSTITISYGAGNKNKNGKYSIRVCKEPENLRLCEIAYNDLKSIPNPSKKDVLKTCATIQWLIAQECPYLRGSDSIANLLTRSIMFAYGLKPLSLKDGVSCDFEAFYRDLDEYVKLYPLLFKDLGNF